MIQINSAAFGSREGVGVEDLVDSERVMTAPELAVLIGIIAAFTTFAAVLAWASWGGGKPVSAPRAVPARAMVRDRVDQIGRATSA